MFFTLLLVTLGISAFVCFVVASLFDKSVRAILTRVVGAELSEAWHRYVIFALYVVGIAGGVPLWQFQQYLDPRPDNAPPLALDAAHWTLEVYRSLIQTLQSIAWMLLAFFAVTLIAYVFVRGFEMKHGKAAGKE